MPTRLLRLVAICWFAMISPVAADGSPVVVELFTSQGCSACPPADALLTEYAPREDVIALALHVDYWDYIGWKDTFGKPAHTQRQRGYAQAADRRYIYTPQMVVDGQGQIKGVKPDQLAAAVEQRKTQPTPVTLKLSRLDENKVRIEASRTSEAEDNLVIQLVRYVPEARIDVRRGENAGKQLLYSNHVTSLDVLRNWSDDDPVELTADVPGDEPVVVIVQRENYGAIVAAARLR